ncbi:MAG: hypothetical protein ACW99U_04220 [Candidatus Thorarchaeota archaeon]|jgi:hypothetical protein
MPTYNLGTLTIADHKADKLTDALGIPEHRFNDLYDLAQKAWDETGPISEGIEYLAQRVSGSEYVISLVFYGRKWEEADQEKKRKEESETEGAETETKSSGLRQE